VLLADEASAFDQLVAGQRAERARFETVADEARAEAAAAERAAEAATAEFANEADPTRERYSGSLRCPSSAMLSGRG
jgi:hypothetical protein